MKPSISQQGIRGIFPLIRQHAPSSIKKLPSFAAVPRSSRLAIDATLLVQRLHFADDNHPSRHVIGFHRLIRQLREHGLIPIMVFDNLSKGSRLPAKNREHEKRRLRRNLLTLRARAESLREQRLQSLARILEEWKTLDDASREKVAVLLQNWRTKSQALSAKIKTTLDDFESYDETREQSIDFWMQFDAIMQEEKNMQKLPDTLEKYPKEADSVILWDKNSPLDTVEMAGYPVFDAELFEDIYNAPIPTPQKMDDFWDEIQESETLSTVRLASQIKNLWHQFRGHAAASSSTTPEIAQALGLDDAGDWPAESPSQKQLTTAEGNVYELLEAGAQDAGLSLRSDSASKSPQVPIDSAKPERSEIEDVQSAEADLVSLEEVAASHMEDLMALSARSAAIHRSYLRSSTSLSHSIFEACETLCNLLKVPVLWTGDGSRVSGRPHEAEAVASMLVRHGYADIVVSEDSDVLLYDVPLLRGVMGHKGLELIDSVQARRDLFPPSIATSDVTFPSDSNDDNQLSASPPLPADLEQAPIAIVDAQQVAESSSKRQMLEFALLCGTDFNRTLPGIAAKRALKLVREFHTIDAIRAEAIKRREKATKQKSKGGKNTQRKQLSSRDSQAITSSALAGDAALRMPDDLSWREYSKELTQARQVFSNPPSLFWHLRKIRDLKRMDALESIYISPEIDTLALSEFLTEQNVSSSFRKQNNEKQSANTLMEHRKNSNHKHDFPQHQVTGFGSSPFGDGGPIASWPG